MGFPNGDIKLSANFELNVSKPLDSRFIVNNLTDRNAISFKYEGMVVWVKSEQNHYKLLNDLVTWVNLSDSGTNTVVNIVDLKDVHISSPHNNDVLLYNSTTSKWVNGQFAIPTPIDVTYSELLSLKDNNQLITGSVYKMNQNTSGQAILIKALNNKTLETSAKWIKQQELKGYSLIKFVNYQSGDSGSCWEVNVDNINQLAYQINDITNLATDIVTSINANSLSDYVASYIEYDGYKVVILTQKIASTFSPNVNIQGTGFTYDFYLSNIEYGYDPFEIFLDVEYNFTDDVILKAHDPILGNTIDIHGYPSTSIINDFRWGDDNYQSNLIIGDSSFYNVYCINGGSMVNNYISSSQIYDNIFTSFFRDNKIVNTFLQNNDFIYGGSLYENTIQSTYFDYVSCSGNVYNNRIDKSYVEHINLLNGDMAENIIASSFIQGNNFSTGGSINQNEMFKTTITNNIGTSFIINYNKLHNTTIDNNIGIIGILSNNIRGGVVNNNVWNNATTSFNVADRGEISYCEMMSGSSISSNTFGLNDNTTGTITKLILGHDAIVENNTIYNNGVLSRSSIYGEFTNNIINDDTRYHSIDYNTTLTNTILP